MDLGQPRPGHAQPELLAQYAAEVVQLQRPHPDVGDVHGHAVEPQRQRQVAVRAPRDEYAHGCVRDAAEGELEHLRGLSVQPLDVVDRDEHGAPLSGVPQKCHDGSREREPVGRLGGSCALERLLEDVALRQRHPGSLGVEERLE